MEALDRDLFGVSPFPAKFQNTKHFIADAQIGHSCADRADYAGEIASEDQRKWCGLAVVIGAHLPVRPVDARREHIDDDLARAGRWVRKIAVFDHLRSAKLVYVSCFHNASAFAFRIAMVVRINDAITIR